MVENEFLTLLIINKDTPVNGWFKISKICTEIIKEMEEKENYIF